MFRTAFGCTQYPKAGRNIQQTLRFVFFRGVLALFKEQWLTDVLEADQAYK